LPDRERSEERRGAALFANIGIGAGHTQREKSPKAAAGRGPVAWTESTGARGCLPHLEQSFRGEGHSMDDVSATGKPPLNALTMSVLAVLVGAVAGMGAVIFRGLIAIFHNLMFLGKLSVFYEANIHTPASPWGPFVILVPVAGAIGVVFLVSNFAPEAKGHGVPEVMDTIYYNRGIIRPVVAVVKSLASALSIGSGGSVGREGPIIQIGSSFGSTVGQWITMPSWQRVTLIAAGTGGGIAATFNTPIGGILFAIEIMLQEVSVRTLVPVTLSTVTATYIGQIFFGTHPAFEVPELQNHYFSLTAPIVLLAYVGLGVLVGLASAGYVRSIYLFEDFFEDKFKGSYYIRHILGMLLVGILLYSCERYYGHYYIGGVGYATIQDVLMHNAPALLLLFALFWLKLLATSLTLGSGASGGIFSPALYMGATLGGVYGMVLSHFFPGLDIRYPAFAVAGMAGVVGGSTGAAMAAIVMIFEMTLDYNVIVPLTITVAISYGIRWTLCRETIYTLKLARRGHYMPQALQTDFQYLKRAKYVMESHISVITASTRLDEFARLAAKNATVSYFVVVEDHTVVGTISIGAALGALDESAAGSQLGDIADKDFVVVSEDTTFLQVITTMRNHRASVALVTSDSQSRLVEKLKGIITKQQVADSVAEAMTHFTE
jgi:CIC family chloride channel protein